MDIHEYQAKAVLAEYGLPIPLGGLAYSPEQAVYRTKEIGGDKWVVKAQIHSGARGKAGVLPMICLANGLLLIKQVHVEKEFIAFMSKKLLPSHERFI